MTNKTSIAHDAFCVFSALLRAQQRDALYEQTLDELQQHSVNHCHWDK